MPTAKRRELGLHKTARSHRLILQRLHWPMALGQTALHSASSLAMGCMVRTSNGSPKQPEVGGFIVSPPFSSLLLTQRWINYTAGSAIFNNLPSFTALLLVSLAWEIGRKLELARIKKSGFWHRFASLLQIGNFRLSTSVSVL